MNYLLYIINLILVSGIIYTLYIKMFLKEGLEGCPANATDNSRDRSRSARRTEIDATISNLKAEITDLNTRISVFTSGVESNKRELEKISDAAAQKAKRTKKKMDNLKISPTKVAKYGVNIAKDGVNRSATQILSQISVNMDKIRQIWPEIQYISREIDEQIEINSHYRGYLKKQKADIIAFKRDENLIIPENLNYDDFSGLSNEIKSKFKKIRPKTMGQALRIDGVTPAAVYILLSHLKRKSIKHIA